MNTVSLRQPGGQILAGLTGVALLFGAFLTGFPELFSPSSAGPNERRPGVPDIYFVPTPMPAVQRLLEMAQVTSKDVVYDLGCGDGRFVITAAQLYGARGVGIDIDPHLIALCRERAKAAGVDHLVEFRQADLFASDFSEATVVALFLLPDLNLQLVPKLQGLQPGSRVISYAFGLEGHTPDQVEQSPVTVAEIPEQALLYRWDIPLRKAPEISPAISPGQ